MQTAIEADTYKQKNFKPTEHFPRLLLIGNVINPSASLYVSDKHYDIENATTGFDVLFRAYLSLNCNFPPQSQHVWEFVQRMIFEFPMEPQKRVASVETFMQDIRNMSN